MSAVPATSLLRSPRCLFLGVVCVGLLAFLLWPQVSARLGFLDRGMWFVDSYALLAASDAQRAGIDFSERNPLDVYHRPHSYSSWWLALGAIGLTGEDNFLLGGLAVLGFVLSFLAWWRPDNRAEAVGAALLLLSPPCLLAINRANNDLFVAALLAAGVMGLTRATPARLGMFGLAVVLATGLKFYPLVAAVGLLAVGSPRWRWLAFGLTLAAAGGVLATEWEWFRRAVIPVPDGLYLYGSAILWRELGFTGGLVLPVSVVLLAMAGAVLAWRRTTAGLADEVAPLAERVAFLAGAAMLAACWLLGISYAYRWILALLLVPWCWRRARAGDEAARLAIGLLAVGLWGDGLFCLVTNTFVGAMPVPRLEAVQHVWQLSVQPLLWCWHALLAGWGVDLLVARTLGWSRLRRPEAGS